MDAPEVLVSAQWAVVTVAAIFAGVVVQRFKTQERLRAIERGVPLPPEPEPRTLSPRTLSPEEQTARYRVAGIICVALGLGLLVLFTSLAWSISKFPTGFVGIAAIPFFIGIGFLIEYRMRRRDQSELR